tara:strand:- start:288 stop:401 length:114 start_codon:yes stop_codon:yes gene_type:complete
LFKSIDELFLDGDVEEEFDLTTQPGLLLLNTTFCGIN